MQKKYIYCTDSVLIWGKTCDIRAFAFKYLSQDQVGQEEAGLQVARMKMKVKQRCTVFSLHAATLQRKEQVGRIFSTNYQNKHVVLSQRGALMVSRRGKRHLCTAIRPVSRATVFRKIRITLQLSESKKS